VTVAANGEEALESWAMAQAANTPYDLVMMDIQMPRLDGIETTRKIREREAGRHAPRTAILALTANTLIDDRHACLESGMDGFLVKPLDQDKLADSLARLIAARHLAAWPESNAVEPDSVLD
jgi:CheY-like chemotaxis protein